MSTGALAGRIIPDEHLSKDAVEAVVGSVQAQVLMVCTPNVNDSLNQHHYQVIVCPRARVVPPLTNSGNRHPEDGFRSPPLLNSGLRETSDSYGLS